MENNLGSLLAYSSTLYEAPFHPPQPRELEASRTLEITVLFTDVQHTLDALRKAGQLARGLHSHIRLVVPQVVPYPLPLNTPPTMLEFTEQRFRVLAEQQAAEDQEAGKQAIDMRVEIYLCRDRNEMLGQALNLKSTVVIGGPKPRYLTFWPTTEERLARRLRRQGHEVILVSPASNENMKKEHSYA